MKHVAAAAGVSVMTVSLALRRAPSIPAATRERVVAAAEQLGYRRNPLVAALMAADLGVEPAAMQKVLEKHVRAQLDDLAEVKPDLR